MTSSDTYQLKWHSHSSHLNGSVAALLRSERFTDVVLCTMDGSQIPAHKFILSSCSIYLSNLFEGQRSVTRMGGMLYVVLPSEITTRALKILVEYMYKGETTVSNEVLDVVLKAGEVLKIRGLWRQPDEAGGDSAPAEKQAQTSTAANKPAKSPDENAQLAGTQKIAIKKNIGLKAFTPVQGAQGTRPMFIGPPKLVFIKTSESGQAQIRPAGPKGQTILVAQSPTPEATVTDRQSPDNATPRIIRQMKQIFEDQIDGRQGERKYGKKQKLDSEEDKDKDNEEKDTTSKKSKPTSSAPLLEAEVLIKEEPDWDTGSIEEEERSIAEMFHAEMSVKSEPIDEVDIDDDGLMYSPLACELCAEVFTVPAQWVRHVQSHATDHHTRRARRRSQSDDTEETMALLRCDLCQKHFPNPAEWVRHIQSTHTETEGSQNKTCGHCKKVFPSHASMLIHTRTHTGERPFVCGLCNKGFNVKSNLLRHLRTLHDQQIGPNVDDDDDDDETSVPPEKSPPRVKNES